MLFDDPMVSYGNHGINDEAAIADKQLLILNQRCKQGGSQ